MTELEISVNHLTGTVPTDLGAMEDMGLFNLRANSLTGTIPSELAQLHHAYWIALGPNQLTGKHTAKTHFELFYLLLPGTH